MDETTKSTAAGDRQEPLQLTEEQMLDSDWGKMTPLRWLAVICVCAAFTAYNGFLGSGFFSGILAFAVLGGFKDGRTAMIGFYAIIVWCVVMFFGVSLFGDQAFYFGRLVR